MGKNSSNVIVFWPGWWFEVNNGNHDHCSNILTLLLLSAALLDARLGRAQVQRAQQVAKVEVIHLRLTLKVIDVKVKTSLCVCVEECMQECELESNSCPGNILVWSIYRTHTPTLALHEVIETIKQTYSQLLGA